MFDSSLRTPLVYAIAVRYQTPLWRAGALLRGGCIAGFWVLLIWFPPGSLPQGAAMLALGSVGAVTAWAHNRSSLLDFLVDRDIPGLGAVARHLLGARERATADLSGLLEGFGIISVALLFAGPVAVRPLPATVYELGTVLIVVHVWSAFLQAMTDSSWYSPDMPPGRTVLLLRPVMPLIVAMILFAILGYPVYWQHQAVPGGLFGVILACAVVLLLLPFTLIYELILRAARDALVLLARRYRAEDAVTVHSLVKNAVYALISEVDSDSGAGAETRLLAREMLALTEEARLLALGRAADLDGVELLWHCVTRVLPTRGQIMAELDPASRSVQLSGTDYQLARRCLVDLMTNAWKAGARRIEVTVRVAEQPGAARPQTVLRVDDDGPGMPPGVLDNPATSLAVMAEHLRGYSGSLTFSARAGAGRGRAFGGSRRGEVYAGAPVRILVIDDYLNVEMALRGILDGHTVAGVRDPAALPRMLAYEEPFETAIVDLRYVQTAATGLTALATLRQLSPGTKTIISTTDEEENRLLYLLAAFQFFEPRRCWPSARTRS